MDDRTGRGWTGSPVVARHDHEGYLHRGLGRALGSTGTGVCIANTLGEKMDGMLLVALFLTELCFGQEPLSAELHHAVPQDHEARV